VKLNSDRKQILIISQYFPPDISGGGTRAYNYAQCLSEQNFDVTVITAYPHLHKKRTKEQNLTNDDEEKFSVIRVWIPSLLHSSIKNRILLHLGFILSSLKPIFLLKPDLIFASEPNLFSIIPAYFYSKIRGGKVIRVVDDLWPEVFYERKLVKTKILKIILNKLAKFSYDFPEYIIPLTEEAKLHISKLYKIDLKKIFVITHGIDTKIFDPLQPIQNNEFIVMYSGALVESYDFELIIQAAIKLKNEKIKFIIRGKGELQNFLKNKVKDLKLKNIIIDEEYVEQNKISSVLNKSDAFIVPLKNNYFLNLSLPTKILEFQALGKPIICCSNGAPGKYIEFTKSGIVVPCGNVSKLVEAIKKLRDEEELCKKLGKNGRKFIKENQTFLKIGEQLKNLISTLI
jgi:glycosyltransferase involved in cell wall biosynthesis|tara:strand:- start:4266 stop:5468 length:1203 start_codon:yes stop_codon:yes gene_type:complete